MISLHPTNESQKYGRPNEATPAKWQADYTDFNAVAETVGTAAAPAATEKTRPDDVAAAPPIPPINGEKEIAEARPEGEKKRKKEEETPEERAERKRRKKEKKEKKEKRKSSSKKGEVGEAESE